MAASMVVTIVDTTINNDEPHATRPTMGKTMECSRNDPREDQ